MSMNLRPLFQGMVRQFSTVTSDDDFKSDFILAVNVSLDELSDRAALLTSMTHITDVDGPVADLDPGDLSILMPGVIVHLIEFANRYPGKDPYPIQLAIWEDKQDMFMVKKSREDQATTDDNDTPLADIAGGGYKGTGTGTGVPSQ